MNSAEYFAAACLALHFLLSSHFPSSDCVDFDGYDATSSYTFLCYIHESYELSSYMYVKSTKTFIKLSS